MLFMSALLVITLALLSSAEGWSQFVSQAPAVSGLNYSYYAKLCPAAESIVAARIKAFLSQDRSEVAGLLRIFFHDCFVQGCDASVLLKGLEGEPTELQAIPNLTLRPKSLKVIDEIKSSLEQTCPGVVSCADIIALATRDAVKEAGGPWFPLPTGRKDSRDFASVDETLSNLPPPSFDVSQLIQSFKQKGLDVMDLVALSGAHTVGNAHCPAFSGRLRPTVDPDLDPTFGKSLAEVCPDDSTDNLTSLDASTPNRFDNGFYKNLLRRKGLLNSDQQLFVDERTSHLVEAFACTESYFFWQFALSFVKLSQIQVLTGTEGEVRRICSATLLNAIV